jgi:hypothetical protein
MAYRPRRWPNYALWALEDVKVMLTRIEADARAVQMAAKEGNRLETVVIAGDIRTAAIEAKAILTRAKEGEYEDETGCRVATPARD